MTVPSVHPVHFRRRQLHHLLRRSIDLLFPPRCVACSRMGTWFCGDCLASVEPIPQPICPCCGRPAPGGRLCAHCQERPTRLDGLRSVAVHAGALRQAIHHLKYRRRRELAAPLGQMLFAYWQRAGLPGDLIIPVPLHASRQKERGFNQAGLLAGVLAESARLPLNETDLIRTRATPSQVGLGSAERRANVQGAFVWTGGGLDGVRVLLIDDVCTSGATLEACALALREGGVDSVWALTLARPLELLD